MENASERSFRGRLERWNDDKGFGFIRSNDSGTDVFVHISAFPDTPRRPIVGDTITYQVKVDGDGRKRAIHAAIEGLASTRPVRRAPRVSPRSRRPRTSRKLRPVALMLVIVIAAGYFYQNFDQIGQFINGAAEVGSDQPMALSAAPADHYRSSSFQCAGKVYCSEMNSCEEAKFYLRNCPGTKMDGDGDGVPCESQWCGW